ncbi:MAG TPA: OmpA family protein [Sphingomicrobium sp.]|nr:OmpA family protein [Sphingomicrobium sp.]
MRLVRFLPSLAAGAALAVSGCAFPGGAPPPPPLLPPAMAVPIAPAYLHSEVIGGQAARVSKARAAGLRPLAPGAVYDYVARQELELRRQTAGTGVDVIRSGERLLLRLPATLTFDVGRAEIKPQALSTLTEIGLTLKRFDQSLVDVLGHTDATGTPAANQALSQRRADAVAAHLRSRGVAAGRLGTRGFGSTYPIGDETTEQGRALNRRVEIKLVPLR